MESQVNALLHVASAILVDAQKVYPALKESFSRDYERIALNCRTRGIGFFTLDLPCLEALLLKGLEDRRLSLSGPVSHKVSDKIRVPRLFSGLWLRVFDKCASLKQEVDVTALAILRQLLTLGKKLELGCTHSRIQATVGAYHDIERALRSPTLGWERDRITSSDQSDDGNLRSILYGPEPSADDQYCHIGSSDRSGCDLLLSALPKEALRGYLNRQRLTREVNIPGLRSVHLAQAADRSDVWNVDLPLFEEKGRVPTAQRIEDVTLLTQIQQVADLVIGSLGVLDPVSLSEDLEQSSRGTGFRHGPGAVAERLKSWEKSHFKRWPHKLEGVFPYALCGTSATGNVRDRLVNHEVASRLIAVPKTTKGPRLIAAEPVAHQWCQQLVLRFLFDGCRKLFRGYFIDFKDQSKSGDLVLQASLDGQLATVDLSDASDRLSCWTVERIFRSNASLVSALHAARTRYLRDDISDVPDFLKLKKFASQGTATTFPVMSLTMLCIALGSCLDGEVTWKRIWELRDQVRVFGDDIVIPSTGYTRLVRAMNLLQLKVNTTKSYVSGRFRESCGVDGYAGYDVTPVKPKTLVANSPSEIQSLIDVSNNFFKKGFWHASEAVLGLIPQKVLSHLPVSKVGTDGFRGLASFTGSKVDHLRLRWNPNLHRIEALTWSSYSKAINKPRDGHPAFLDFVSRSHSHEFAREVSVVPMTRVTKSRRSWEPIDPRGIISPENRSRFGRAMHGQAYCLEVSHVA